MRTHTRSAIFGRLRAFMLMPALMPGVAPAHRALAASSTLVAWRWHSYGGPIVLGGVGAHAIGLFGADNVGNTGGVQDAQRQPGRYLIATVPQYRSAGSARAC
jgi:hypothetical protein